MSIIAYDGKRIAADRQGTCTDMKCISVKIMLCPKSKRVFACTGQEAHFSPLVSWWHMGCREEDYPKFQSSDDWSRLIVASATDVVFFEKVPYGMLVQDPFFAWGSGRDFAMGAMAAGADAVEAVQIASAYNIYCGMGIDVYTLSDIGG